MVKGGRNDGGVKGELLYTEKIPLKLQPRKVLAGNRWAIFENLGRVAEIGLLAYIAYTAMTADLSDMSNVFKIVMLSVALALMVYVTEVISPRGRRMSVPIKVFTKGVEVHTSHLEEVRGYPQFVPREMIDKLIVRRISVDLDGKKEIMPTNLKLALTNGKVLDLGRRNYHELETIIRTMKERYGVNE